MYGIIDESDKFRLQNVNSIAVDLGLEKDPAIIRDVYANGGASSLHGLIRICLRRQGASVENASAHELCNAITSPRMHAAATSDFSAILADVANKRLLKSYDEAFTSYQFWTGEEIAKDFNTISLVKMSNFSDIDDIPEGMGFKQGKFSDNRETASVTTKGKMFSLTRQAIVNDDLQAFIKIPAAMGASIKRRINRDAYDTLCFNSLVGPAMADTVALFNEASHHNLKTSSGAISVANLSVVEQKLLEMPLPAPDNSSGLQTLGIPARYLITGTANRLIALQVLGSAFDLNFSTVYTGAQAYNPYSNGAITPVFDSYLQSLLTAAGSGNAFYLAVDPSQVSTISIVYLQGNRVPIVRGEPAGIGEAFGFIFAVHFDYGIAVADHRGLVFADGK